MMEVFHAPQLGGTLWAQFLPLECYFSAGFDLHPVALMVLPDCRIDLACSH